MSQELVVLQAVRTATGTVGELLQMVREHRTVRASDLARLRAQMAAIERQAHARNIGELARIHLKELIETSRVIESAAPSEATYVLCQDHLRQLSQELAANMTGFSRG